MRRFKAVAHAIGELHVGEAAAKKVEAAIDQLLKASVE